MRRVAFHPDALQGDEAGWWADWHAKADTATTGMHELYDAGNQPDPSAHDKVWGDLKRWLLEHVFDGKCAYCDGKPAAFGPQDAEHWRPKSAVTDPTSGEKPAKVTLEGRPHPGYWWLALRWENLVPACKACNAGRGKGTKFPIAGRYAFSPADGTDFEKLNEIEKPLLLHPFFGERPEDHIGFYEDGTAFARDTSEFGRWTIEVMDLNRDELVDRRRERIEDAARALGLAALDIVTRDDPGQAMSKWTGPAAEFCQAVHDAVGPRLRALRAWAAGSGS